LFNPGRLPELRRKSTGFFQTCKRATRKKLSFCAHFFPAYPDWPATGQGFALTYIKL